MEFSTLSYHAGSSYKRGPFTLFSAVRDQDSVSTAVLVKLISKEHPYFLEGARQLEHEHGLSHHLDLTRIVRSISLERSQYYVALVFEDSHTISLDRIITRKLNILEFLLFANDICYALMELHSKHIVHRNLNPQNIYYFSSDNLFKIAGMEFAQFEHDDYQSDEDRHLFKESLPYISPEQTSRTTLRVDHRSDLYSVGMIFYEMLTNQLAFNADTPADWIYCHLTKLPVPPSDLNPKVPAMVSKIVLKLLNKVPKERYQSAYGLKMDLERCLTQLKNENRIHPFSLATEDIPARIETPKHIYGREKELDLLSLAFKRVSSVGITELALVLGYAGVGKTSLITSFLQKISGPFTFASGKFDEYNRTVPYFAIKQALASLCRQLLSKNEEELKSWKNTISTVFSVSSAIIANLVPEVQYIIGKQPQVPAQSGPEAKHQFQNAFKSFIKIFSNINHPLILFLDDLQWADEESLDLIEYILAQKDMEYFLLIGAFRDHEINASHPRAIALQKLEQVGVRSTLIKLNSMTRDELKVMLKDTLKTGSRNVDQLSKIIYEKTEGNPFFSIELLKNIESQNLIWFNWIQKRWEWDSDTILKMEYSTNVIDLMTDRLRRLPESSQKLLMFAASLGNFFQKSILLNASGWTEKELDQELNLISSLGFIVEASQGNDSGFSFVHDRIRQTAYLLIPETDRADIHLQIGRRLVSSLSPSLVELWSFDLANHFNLASSLLSNEEEIDRVILLNLMAGRASKKTTAYKTALFFLLKAAELFEQKKLKSKPDLAYSIHFELAQCYLLLGDLHKSQEIVKRLLVEEATLSQQIPVLLLSIQVNTALGNLDIAVQSLISTLQPFGMSVPLHPTREQIMGEYSDIWDKLGDREINELANLPLMTDERMKTVMTILSTVLPTLLFFDPDLLSMVLCKMVQISLQYGNSPASPLSYVFFGMIIGPRFMMYSKGYAFGHLAYQLIERNELSEFKAQVIHCFATFCNHWKNHISTSIPILNRAFTTAVETNDMLYTCYCKIHSGMLRFVKGDHLNEVLKELSDSRIFVNNLGFIESEEVIAVHQQLIKCLIGLTVDVSGFTDATFDQENYERDLDNRFPITRCWFYIRRTIACCILDNHTDAITSAQQAIPLLWTSPSFLEFTEFYYYYSLSLAAQCQKVQAEEKEKYISILLENEKMFKEWARICPSNFKNMHYLIHAELLKVRGEHWKAAQFYEKAIRSSEKSGFIQKQAICYQAAAQFFNMSGLTTVANEYIWKAREFYSRWGANGKVRQLDGRFPELIMRKASLEKKRDTITSQDVDLMSVIQASQAISGELIPERLLNTVCEILLKQSGAQTGYILLVENEALTLAAKASGTRNKTKILLLNSKPSAKLVLGPTHGPINSKELPISVIQYTLRTLEKVALHDATQSGQFVSDVYIKEHKPKSILSVPMMSQGKLIGIVYLENNLVPGAFTPGKIKTLELITLQAAIAIEISMVYSKNQEIHRELQRILDSTSVVIYIKDIEGRFTFINERFERTFRVHKDDVIGKTDFDIFEPEKAAVFRNNDKQVIETRSESQFEELMIHDDGVHTYISVKVPLFDLDGNIYAVCGISTDITERKKVETQRITLVRELEKTIRVRDEFIAIASHELKTPLTSLRLQMSLMMKAVEDQSSENASCPNLFRQIVTSSQRQTDRLVALTNDLLDISAIRAEKFAMESGQFNLSSLLLKITNDLKMELRTSGQEFVITIEEEVLISGDQKRLEQVFINLINNALKFGLGKPIEISLTTTKDYVKFFVRDHGQGIKEQDLVRIFEPFERAVSHRNYGGLGLGLYISKEIIDAHRGQVEVVSSWEEGALFKVTLPKY